MRGTLLGVACIAAALFCPPAALAQSTAGSVPAPVTVPTTLPAQPADFTVDASQAINAANADPEVERLRTSYPRLSAVPAAKPGHRWEVGYSSDGAALAVVVVDAGDGTIIDTWTGDQVAWPMARGNSGQFGHILNAPYVWIPLALIFLCGLLDFRRLRRIAHLDLIVLLSFGISQVFFDRGEIGVSVPLAVPPMLYLLARSLWIGFRGPGDGLRPSAPLTWLAIATIFLCGFRVAVNAADSGVIDVGYSGVIGADRITHLDPVYGEGAFPTENGSGDTYGPANYLAYVPFEQALPWSGKWDDLPAAHAASILFDLAAIGGLLLLGRRLRGWKLGVTLAFAWAAFPYTDYALQSNSNDALVGALLIWALALFGSLGWRATLLAVATAVKFTPLALVPLFAAGDRGLLGAVKERRLPLRTGVKLAYFACIFGGVLALLFIYPAIDPGLATTWERTVATQLGRDSPFSIWGQVPALQPLHTVLLFAIGGLGAALAFVPRRRTPAQVAALTAAAIIGVELTLQHWFYLYIPWFLGPLLVGIAVSRAHAPLAEPESEEERGPAKAPSATVYRSQPEPVPRTG